MTEIPYLIFIIAALLIAGAVVFATRIKKGNKFHPDYYNLFITGIIWTAIGIPLELWPLVAIGIPFMLAGIIHKKEWKETHKKWNQLDDKTRKRKLWILLILGIIILAGILAIYLIR